jgi:D-aminopeptidase
VCEGARRAVELARSGALRPLVIAPAEIEVEYRDGGAADHAAIVPGAVRFGDTGVRHSGPDALTAYRGFLAGVRLAGLVG